MQTSTSSSCSQRYCITCRYSAYQSVCMRLRREQYEVTRCVLHEMLQHVTSQTRSPSSYSYIAQLADDIPAHQAPRCQIDTSVGHPLLPQLALEISHWTSKKQVAGPMPQRLQSCSCHKFIMVIVLEWCHLLRGVDDMMMMMMMMLPGLQRQGGHRKQCLGDLTEWPG